MSCTEQFGYAVAQSNVSVLHRACLVVLLHRAMCVCVAQSNACVAQSNVCVLHRASLVVLLHRAMCVCCTEQCVCCTAMCVLHRACLVVLLHRAMGGHLRSFDGTDKVAQIKVIEANIFGCKSHVSKFAAGRA